MGLQVVLYVNLVNRSQQIGESIHVRMTEGSPVIWQIIKVTVESPYFSVRVHAATTKDLLFDPS